MCNFRLYFSAAAILFLMGSNSLLSKNEENTSSRVFIDLTSAINDRLTVEMTIPQLKASDTLFVMPRSAPGTYDALDFGKYIVSIVGVDNKNNEIPILRTGDNSFRIADPEQIKKLRYVLDDSWDDTDTTRERLFNPGSVNFQLDTMFALNLFGVCGYFPSLKKMPYYLSVRRPEFMKFATALSVLPSQNIHEDRFYAEDYDRLADSPILYAKEMSIKTITLRGAEISVAVYSENNRFSASDIIPILQPIMEATADFFGKMPVQHYTFLFVFSSNKKNIGKGGWGALEHSYSSMYYLPEPTNISVISETIEHTVSHEFLHIKIPLHLHSEEIADFDFLHPKMSKHLWLYEGVTEYFAVLAQTKYKGEKSYALSMRKKIFASASMRNRDIPMLEFSQKVMEPDMQELYPMIYDRGALLAFGLDMELRAKTNNAFTLQRLVDTLSSLYGKKRPFKDDELFDVIRRITPCDISEYIENYIVRGMFPPLEKSFNVMGYNYFDKKEVNGYSFGKIDFGFKPQSIYLRSVDSSNTLGLKSGDILKSIRGEEISMENPVNIQAALPLLLRPRTDDELSIVVERNGVEMSLKARPTAAVVNERFVVEQQENPTEIAKTISRDFFGK